jgi:nucleotide-binding universal stress UspA family protein
MNQHMKVLIGYDGSSGANAALHDLRRAGLPQTVEAVVMSMADVLLPPHPSPAPDADVPPSPASMPEAARQARLRAQQAVEEAEALAKRANERLQASFPVWNVRAEACADSPAWGLINKADAWRADLLVVGSHGRSPLGRLILGSVSQKGAGAGTLLRTHCAGSHASPRGSGTPRCRCRWFDRRHGGCARHSRARVAGRQRGPSDHRRRSHARHGPAALSDGRRGPLGVGASSGRRGGEGAARRGAHRLAPHRRGRPWAAASLRGRSLGGRWHLSGCEGPRGYRALSARQCLGGSGRAGALLGRGRAPHAGGMIAESENGSRT